MREKYITLVAFCAAVCVGIGGASGCQTEPRETTFALHSSQQLLAIDAAREVYQRRFPREYAFATWEIIVVEEQGNLWVLFALPISDQEKAALGDIPRQGRVFIVSTDGSQVIDTMII